MEVLLTVLIWLAIIVLGLFIICGLIVFLVGGLLFGKELWWAIQDQRAEKRRRRSK